MLIFKTYFYMYFTIFGKTHLVKKNIFVICYVALNLDPLFRYTYY
jgi:hypothetical protein